MRIADFNSYNFFLFSKFFRLYLYRTYERDLNFNIQSFEFHRMKCRKRRPAYTGNIEMIESIRPVDKVYFEEFYIRL